MKVSKRSWHYRLYCFWRQVWDDEVGFTFVRLLVRKQSLRDYYPKNLCRYFWVIVANTLLTWVVLLLIGVLFLIVAPIVWLAFTYVESDWRRKRIAKSKERQEESQKSEKGPNLLTSFVRAKKQKVCPIIEIID